MSSKKPKTPPATAPAAIPAPNANANALVDAALVMKSIATMVSLKGERDHLRAEIDRRDWTIRQLQNAIETKDRAFDQMLRERDAWHKTAEVIEERRDISNGRAAFWRFMFFMSVATYALVFIGRHFIGR